MQQKSDGTCVLLEQCIVFVLFSFSFFRFGRFIKFLPCYIWNDGAIMTIFGDLLNVYTA